MVINCCISVMDKSLKVDQWQDNHNSNFILVIQLNMGALEQSEPLGHGHYTFYPIDQAKILKLIKPRDYSNQKQ